MKRLPPGQTEITDFPRWGLPEYMYEMPDIPLHPALELAGDVSAPCQIALQELASLPRHEQTSDFHCAATWSRLGLRWGGYRFRDFYERILGSLVKPHTDVRYVVLHGLDGYTTSLPLEDALAEDVLLADRLDGEPLSFDHGAPIRVVAPAHYGYKSAKHLRGVEVLAKAPDYAGRLSDTSEHPRARVALEERGTGRTGEELRAVYSAALESMLQYFRDLTGRDRS